MDYQEDLWKELSESNKKGSKKNSSSSFNGATPGSGNNTSDQTKKSKKQKKKDKKKDKKKEIKKNDQEEEEEENEGTQPQTVSENISQSSFDESFLSVPIHEKEEQIIPSKRKKQSLNASSSPSSEKTERNKDKGMDHSKFSGNCSDEDINTPVCKRGSVVSIPPLSPPPPYI